MLTIYNKNTQQQQQKSKQNGIEEKKTNETQVLWNKIDTTHKIISTPSSPSIPTIEREQNAVANQKAQSFGRRNESIIMAAGVDCSSRRKQRNKTVIAHRWRSVRRALVSSVFSAASRWLPSSVRHLRRTCEANRAQNKTDPNLELLRYMFKPSI